MKFLYLIFACLCLNVLHAQPLVKDKLSQHVYFLADDKLEGRATGSPGEKMALNYISDVFIQYGIEPKGENGFVQPFEFSLGKKVGINNYFSIGETTLKYETDYFPLPYTSSGEVSGELVEVGFGIDAPDLYSDYSDLKDLKGKIFMIELSSPDGIHPHSKYTEYSDYKTKIKTAVKYGAVAVVFVNSDENLDNPENNLGRNVTSEKIPILFLNNKELLNENKTKLLKISVDLYENNRTGNNVIGYINNNAEKTIIIGAHYDHLGYGFDGGSLYRGQPAIHNGADDNASGIALMLELSKKLKESSNRNNNYLFIAFSGEELGLFGSKVFTESPTIDMSKTNYMVNFDMVGMLDEEKNLAVNGVGTSPIFDSIFNAPNSNFKINTTQSGMGPSDHSSFYLKNIPVLHFFTGSTAHYHKPTDDPFRLNYDGIEMILDYVFDCIVQMDNDGKLAFTKTKDADARSTPKFKVTLGVVPNYMFDGVGMKIDAVTDEKPAFKAGIQAGDIVVKMGSLDISDMMSYMVGLSKFEKGETTDVVVLRNGERKTLKVTF